MKLNTLFNTPNYLGLLIIKSDSMMKDQFTAGPICIERIHNFHAFKMYSFLCAFNTVEIHLLSK